MRERGESVSEHVCVCVCLRGRGVDRRREGCQKFRKLSRNEGAREREREQEKERVCLCVGHCSTATHQTLEQQQQLKN